MRDPHPAFPPLLTGHRLTVGRSPAVWAEAEAAAGRLGAGDLVWSEDPDDLRFALVLEPVVMRLRCQEILFAAMVAAGDSIGALSPPEVSITYQWPSVILANEAEIGFADIVISEADHEGAPEWMVVSLTLRIRPKRGQPEPGHEADRTTLWDEGCGALGKTALLESVSRHLINIIHSWSEDGFKPVHDQWLARISGKQKLAAGAAPYDGDHEFLGLGESGEALIKTGSGTHALMVMDVLIRLRTQRGEAA
ncbi:MAG TPA: biotin/lipoate--protein ligase family protein [Hyphomicrobiales bacterium]|nr:biotin/lipoate--protein ligase family protein [Hyphomicrobiales bacterium]